MEHFIAFAPTYTSFASMEDSRMLKQYLLVATITRCEARLK